jgi:predicted secreted protein
MGWATGIMVYLVIWWIALFMVLPLGVRRVENPGRGQETGAPERPEMLRKAIITTIVSAVLWIAFYGFYQLDLLSFRRLEGT